MSSLSGKAALFVLHGVGRLPLGAIRFVSNPIGDLLYILARPRRRVTLTNLRLCFPDWTEKRRREIARKHFRVFVTTVFERFKFWFGPAEQLDELCVIEGLEHIRKHKDQPVIVLAPHFVGMDAGGVRYNRDYEMFTMYAAQKSSTLTNAMTAGRMRFGGEALLRTDGVRPVIRKLRKNMPFYFLPDMDLGPRDAVFVPFFGVPAATVTSVARLARLARAKVVPCVTTLSDNGYVTRFYPAWDDFPGDDDTAATARMNRFIEQRVLETPEQYLWSHKRFKTRPEGEPSVY
jgi:KDO2-lipid IV(A) lauroyltransferase